MASWFLNRLGYSGAEATKENQAVRALPASWYTSTEMYELERRAIFSRRWLLLTHKSRLVEAGSWLRFDVAGFNMIVARDRKENRIYAMHNVCRHRAYPVVEKDSGTSHVFACRYHGWSYGLKGNLAKAPGYQDLAGFDQSKNGLFPIHVHVDGNGFIYINMDAKQTPEVSWDDDFGGLDTASRLVDKYDFSNYDFDHTWEMEDDFNWKILADNYNECYHCKTTHPDIPAVATLEAYDVRPSGAHIDHDAASTPEQEARGLNVTSTYFFPNASLNVTPHFMFLQRFIPCSPTRSRMHYQVWRNRNSPDTDFQHISQIYRRVMSEDKVLCEAAQKNLNAGVFTNGEMHPHMEKGPLYFQKCARDAVTDHYKKERVAGNEIWPARPELPETKNAAPSVEDEAFCKGLSCQANGMKDQLAW